MTTLLGCPAPVGVLRQDRRRGLSLQTTISHSSIGIDPHTTRAALIPRPIYETLRYPKGFMSVLPSIPAKAGWRGEMRDAAMSAA